MKIKKVLSLVLVFMLLLSTTSAFAAVPEGTIVFGNVAYDLQALADDSFTSEILGNYRDNNNDFAYKKIGGDWVNSLNNETTPELPATITLKKGDGTTEIITVEEPTGELKVVGVSAINAIEVAFNSEEELDLPSEVTVTLNDEDATEETLAVEWADNEDYDVTVPGEYTFTGTIEYPEEAEYEVSEEFETVEAVVTVLEPTTEQINDAVAAVRTADAAGILEALQSPVLAHEGLEGVNEDFATEYHAKISANTALVTSVTRVQQYVNLVNAEQGDALQVLVDAVNDAVAALDLIDLKTALTDPDLGLENVLDPATTFDTAYLIALEAATTETKQQIQDVIDAVNLEEVTKLLDAAEASLDQDDLDKVTDAPAGILGLFEGEQQEELVNRKADIKEKIDIATAIGAVNALISDDIDISGNALNTALNLPALDLENVESTNEQAYADKLEELHNEDNDFEFKTVAEIQAFVDEVNASEEAGLVTVAIAAVNSEVAGTVEADDLLTALQHGDLDLDNVDPVNKAAYGTALEAKFNADNDFEFETVEEIQAFVDAVNLAEAIDAVNDLVSDDVDAGDLFAALDDTILDLDNVVERNKEVYASELEAIFEDDNTFEFKTVAEIQAFVDAANATPVGKVNTAKNTADMKAALENDDLELDLAVYNALTSLEKNLVAQKLRADGTEFADAEGIQTELNVAVLDILGL